MRRLNLNVNFRYELQLSVPFRGTRDHDDLVGPGSSHDGWDVLFFVLAGRLMFLLQPVTPDHHKPSQRRKQFFFLCSSSAAPAVRDE